MSLTPTSPIPISNLKIPGNNYHHTMSIETLETTPNNNEVKEATIEIQVQGWYQLYVQPLKDHLPKSMENGYIMSPKFTYEFKLPLSDLTNITLHLCFPYISQELAKLPMSSGLAMYLKPHIFQNVMAMTQQNPTLEFKLVFDVKVVTVDFADHQECEGYRRRYLV